MKQLVLPLLCLIQSALSAQQSPITLVCGNDVFSHIVRKRYPDLQASFDATFEEAALRAREGGTDDRSVFEISVVVHVVWKTADENLADSIIEDQIRILNEDFNRLNADSVDLRPVFQPHAGSAGIRFKIAKIVRKQTTKNFSVNLLSGQLLSELKSDALGGSNGWDPQQYLNIWVCNIRPSTFLGIPLAQILGFAFPPNGLAHWPAGASAPTPQEDGVVVDYRVFGSNNPNGLAVPGGTGNLTVRGRTPTHEVGHYLGLRHIWGDGGSLLSSTNDCKQSDGVDDTPFAASQANFDCNKSKNTCTQVDAFYGSDVPDMIENFMDYAKEDCMNTFTKGQVAIMRSVLSGPRSGLVGSVSVKHPTQVGSLTLMPNPSKGLVRVQLPNVDGKTVHLNVFDTNGRLVYEEPNLAKVEPTGSFDLDLGRLAKGLYWVQVRTEQNIWTKKLFFTE